MELFLDLGSLYFYIRRRGKIVLAVTILNFLMWWVGLWATMKLHYYGLMAHAVYGISLVGGFYIYIIIDGLIVAGGDIEMANQDDGQLSQFWVRIISSLPHLGIFMMGIYSLVLLIRLDDEISSRK